MIMTFLVSLGGRALIIGGGIVALLALYVANNHRVVSKERARVSIEANKTDAKAQPARRAAERDPGRVLERYRRD